jgi:hypothetical protein
VFIPPGAPAAGDIMVAFSPNSGFDFDALPREANEFCEKRMHLSPRDRDRDGQQVRKETSGNRIHEDFKSWALTHDQTIPRV